jgi:D-aminopeptidase
MEPYSMSDAKSAAGSLISSKLDELLRPWNRSDAPGLVIGVTLGGVPLYRRGFGLSSVELGTANTPKTRMRIGSSSKHFAALCALLLAEQGKLDLDRPARTYLPELTGVSGEPSLRQMMQHTSGLRDPFDLPLILVHGSMSTIVAPGAGFEFARRFSSTNYPAGERMVYCNQGYHLLSLAIERVSGMPYAAFLAHHVLAPLGMTDTALLASDMQMTPGLASLHVPQPDGSYRRGIYPSEELLGAGGMISTVDDMLKWLAHLRGANKRVGSAASWEQMLRRPRYSSGAEGDYCLGLICEDYRGVETIHHAGAVVGGTCQMLTVPEHQLDISLMFNRMDGAAPALALKVVDAVLGEKLQAAVPPLPAKGRETLVGRWYSAASRRMFGVVAQPVPEQEPVLALSIQDQVGGLLREVEGGMVMTCSAHGAVVLRLPADAEPQALEILDSGHAERYVRLPAAGPAAGELAPQLLGRYRQADLGVDLSVVFDQDALYLNLYPRSGFTRFRLLPYSAEVCGCALDSSWPMPLPAALLGAVLSIERRGGKVAGLWLNSWRTRNLWLERCT